MMKCDHEEVHPEEAVDSELAAAFETEVIHAARYLSLFYLCELYVIQTV